MEQVILAAFREFLESIAALLSSKKFRGVVELELHLDTSTRECKIKSRVHPDL